MNRGVKQNGSASARQRPGVRWSSTAFERAAKRQRTGALQDAGAPLDCAKQSAAVPAALDGRIGGMVSITTGASQHGVPVNPARPPALRTLRFAFPVPHEP